MMQGIAARNGMAQYNSIQEHHKEQFDHNIIIQNLVLILTGYLGHSGTRNEFPGMLHDKLPDFLLHSLCILRYEL
jgi:hypothetical protein